MTYPWKLSVTPGFVQISQDMYRYPYISVWSKFQDGDDNALPSQHKAAEIAESISDSLPTNVYSFSPKITCTTLFQSSLHSRQTTNFNETQ
jgi:hypothetical protein